MARLPRRAEGECCGDARVGGWAFRSVGGWWWRGTLNSFPYSLLPSASLMALEAVDDCRLEAVASSLRSMSVVPPASYICTSLRWSTG